MTEQELFEWCEEQTAQKTYLEFPEELFDALPKDIAERLAERFGSTTMIKLPAREIKFFEWLKEADKAVWDDLWAEVAAEELYTVGMLFLPLLTEKTRGFPICDLIANDNYYFTEEHFLEKESAVFVESVKQRFLAKKNMTLPQMLALEITIAPIDIWHFAYRHNADLTEAKAAVEILSEDSVLIHLTKAEHLAGFIQI